MSSCNKGSLVQVCLLHHLLFSGDILMTFSSSRGVGRRNYSSNGSCTNVFQRNDKKMKLGKLVSGDKQDLLKRFVPLNCQCSFIWNFLARDCETFEKQFAFHRWRSIKAISSVVLRTSCCLRLWLLLTSFFNLISSRSTQSIISLFSRGLICFGSSVKHQFWLFQEWK